MITMTIFETIQLGRTQGCKPCGLLCEDCYSIALVEMTRKANALSAYVLSQMNDTQRIDL